MINLYVAKVNDIVKTPINRHNFTVPFVADINKKLIYKEQTRYSNNPYPVNGPMYFAEDEELRKLVLVAHTKWKSYSSIEPKSGIEFRIHGDDKVFDINGRAKLILSVSQYPDKYIVYDVIYKNVDVND